MIPKNVRPGATSEGLDGERASFQIEANGKAFRTLIDGLYANKIQAVIRELSSNARDSHIEAGQARPFEVSIPTHLDPTFRVRDFGVSLSHEGVMGLYTTIFKSTKETTNTQTGQLGLGSKSPFAYTDTFSVVAYLNGERRVYVAFLETDGVPCITHVGNSPTDEPNGLEVSFPAKRQDMREFQCEMVRVSLGYQTGQVKIHGLEVKHPEPRLVGEGWALYPSRDLGSYNQANFVRMGSVVYPIQYHLDDVSSNYSAVIDVPIGICDVTASREALSMDDDTKRFVREAIQRVNREVIEQVKDLIEQASDGSRVKRAKANEEYGSIMHRLGPTTVSLIAESNVNQSNLRQESDRTPGDVLESARYYGRSQNIRRRSARYISNMEVNHLGSVIIVLDDTSQKLVRRYKRIKEFGDRKANVWVFASDKDSDLKKAKAWIKKCWEISDEQFVNSQDIADCPPPKRTGPGSGTKAAPRVRKPDQLWMGRRYGSVQSEIYGEGLRNGTWPAIMRQAADLAEVSLGDIFWVNAVEEKKMTALGQLPKSHKLDVVIERKVKAIAKRAKVAEAQEWYAVSEMVGRYNSALPVVLERFFPTLAGMNGDRAHSALNTAKIAGIDLQKVGNVDSVKAQVRALTNEYPLLFQKSGRNHFEQYVDAIQASKTNNKEEVTA